MDAREISTLRLSARTLGEWRTPASTCSYERVLSDLLSVHPFARELGIDAASKVLSLDGDGTILWYLSETLSSYPVPISTDDDLQWWIAQGCIAALIDFAGIGRDDTEVWPHGPLKSQVADAIDLTLEKGLCTFRDFRETSEHLNRDPQPSRSAAALVSIAAPLGRTTSLAMMMQLKANYPNRGYLQKMSLLIIKLIRAMKATQTISVTSAGIGALTSIAGLSLGLEATSIFGGITIVTLVIAILSKLVGDQVQNNAVGVLEFLERIARELTGSNETAFPRLHKLEASKKEALGSGLICALGRICGDRNQAMISLFREASDDMWRRAALLGTKSVKASIVRELLPIIRSSELHFGMRNELLKWLFSVAINEG